MSHRIVYESPSAEYSRHEFPDPLPGGWAEFAGADSEANFEAATPLITSPRRVDKTRSEFSIKASMVADFVWVVFGEGSHLIGVSGLDNSESFITGNMAVKVIHSFDLFVAKRGMGLTTTVMYGPDLIFPQPPQANASPSVAKRWQTFPRVSVRGDYLGADYRTVAGRLQINIDNLTHEWIETRWEPFREHVSKGGAFAYIPGEITEFSNQIDAAEHATAIKDMAYCYAEGSVPAPVLKAGGFGSVSLTAGVVPGL